jgi:excisionase family DNA binding protein
MTLETRDQLLYALKQSFDGALTVAGILFDELCNQSESKPAGHALEGSQSPKIEDFLTVKEAAALLKVSQRTIYEWDAQGRIPTRRVGGELRFLREELLAWTEKEANKVRERTRPTRRGRLRIAGKGVID